MGALLGGLNGQQNNNQQNNNDPLGAILGGISNNAGGNQNGQVGFGNGGFGGQQPTPSTRAPPVTTATTTVFGKLPTLIFGFPNSKKE